MYWIRVIYGLLPLTLTTHAGLFFPFPNIPVTLVCFSLSQYSVSFFSLLMFNAKTKVHLSLWLFVLVGL